VSTADAVAREAAWLNTIGDSLPSLPASAGGPWEIVQAYQPRTPPANKTAIYVLRGRLLDVRASNQRIRPRYEMRLRLVWPVVVTGTGLLETAQADMDGAVDLLVQRVRGPLGDKTHGQRFLSAGENPRLVTVQWDPPELAMAAHKQLTADMLYSVDDLEVND
jgi:hypothetical protein